MFYQTWLLSDDLCSYKMHKKTPENVYKLLPKDSGTSFKACCDNDGENKCIIA